MRRVNYDLIAPDYDRRFVSSGLEERGKALQALGCDFEREFGE